jgi:hypothetical protein
MIEGETAAPAILSTPNLDLEPLRENSTRRPAQHTATAPNFLLSHTRGRHLSYLIGQQRAQSIPHDVSKSSANKTPKLTKLFPQDVKQACSVVLYFDLVKMAVPLSMQGF